MSCSKFTGEEAVLAYMEFAPAEQDQKSLCPYGLSLHEGYNVEANTDTRPISKSGIRVCHARDGGSRACLPQNRTWPTFVFGQSIYNTQLQLVIGQPFVQHVD